MLLSEKQSEFLWMIHDMLTYVSLRIPNGHYLVETEYNRTPERQRKLFEEGVSWTLRSKHITRLAKDYLLYKGRGIPVWHHPFYEEMGKYWESIGGKWGVIKDGKQVDPYHFEYKDSA